MAIPPLIMLLPAMRLFMISLISSSYGKFPEPHDGADAAGRGQRYARERGAATIGRMSR